MKGIIIHGPKDLRIEDVAVAAPAAGEVRVKVATGGICGSDLHYFHHGGFGQVRLKEPMALGHELSGVVAELGEGVSGIQVGTRVAVNPSRPCGRCRYCATGMRNQCIDMRFMGSAMRSPHVQGGFRQTLTIDATQAVPIPDSLSLAEAAVAEPLAVCLHAARQAGPLMGKRVLVTGCGPIGALAVLVARMSGAAEIIVTDVASFPLKLARSLGADRTISMADEPEGLAPFYREKGQIDVLFEASGVEAALRSAVDAIRPGGTIVQLGLGGDMTLPMNVIVAKELRLAGTFRFDQEFALAVELMGLGRIDVKPLITDALPFERAVEAFTLATDRSRSMKVQLGF